ncbi:hypothetical protein [Foetidibacter luteolus]|uniref:hypothetical protein n=1 Tax=Foetidibacter luteolus TaxID=2608880 RepID=UPI00129A821B|nr:hypothetical protein [Foetidibacter luteolus]
MKYLLLFCMVAAGGNLSAQCKTFTIGVKGDTLNCIDVNNMKQGKWVEHIEPLRGEPGYEQEGVYKNSKKDGLWRKYSLQGDILAMENYRFGNKNGRCQYFNLNGLVREESWRAIDPANPYDTINVYDLKDENKIYAKVIRVDASVVKHGEWRYYDPVTGALEKTENYQLGQIYEPNKKVTVIDASAGDSTKTAQADKKVKPKEIAEWEKKNSGKKKIKVRDGRTGY